MVDAIRGAGAVPAWVGVLGGEVVVGLSDEELRPFTEPGRADKVARRDLPAACARGGLGATTVSASIWAAARAGIVVSATGGIGGVHPGDHVDVSADLVELSRNPGLLVCSGPKSIIDPRATSERLEELGVTMVGYGVSRLPFFLTREAPIDLEHRVETPDEAAAILAGGDRSGHALDHPAVQSDLSRGGDGCRRGRGRDTPRGGASRDRGHPGEGAHALPARRHRRADRRDARWRRTSPYLLRTPRSPATWRPSPPGSADPVVVGEEGSRSSS